LRTERALVGRCDCTKLVDGVLIGGEFATPDVQALWPKRLEKLLTETQGAVEVAAVRESLAANLTPA